MFTIVLLGFTAITISSYIYCLVAYADKVKNSLVYSYGLAIIAAIISVSAWTYVIRNYKDPNSIMVINCIWDIGVTIMVLAFPIFLFDFKIDTKTIIGCVISVIGIVIAKI